MVTHFGLVRIQFFVFLMSLSVLQNLSLFVLNRFGFLLPLFVFTSLCMPYAFSPAHGQCWASFTPLATWRISILLSRRESWCFVGLLGLFSTVTEFLNLKFMKLQSSLLSPVIFLVFLWLWCQSAAWWDWRWGLGAFGVHSGCDYV